MYSNSELRAMARDALRGNWGMAVLVIFLFTVISYVIGVVPVAGAILGLILAGPLSFGLYAYFLRTLRGQRPELSVIFSGFQQFVPTLVLYLLTMIFVFLWSLLLVIPGIIAALRYSMAYYILHDFPGMSGFEALSHSKEMMRGHKGRLFLLYLSFIGWALLCIPTFGIGYLWLAPYMQTSMAAFYDQLKTHQPAAPNPTMSM